MVKNIELYRKKILLQFACQKLTKYAKLNSKFVFICMLSMPGKFTSIDNSERSEECIDFTMIITSRNNAPISNYRGVNIFQQFSKKLKKKQKKNDGKTGIFTQNQFSTKSNFFYGCNSKTNH
ncbi:hypothetical protein FWK35_00020010 [Aphis craccivora]|uniref:Uncharacterized protein n=1 Tax=Aphis craccivora TaxID=307492 RepID=A0A6G0YQC9_APHCR|nr:hypothetical protein FWK35_00020010 [Aphis craccivora]